MTESVAVFEEPQVGSTIIQQSSSAYLKCLIV